MKRQALRLIGRARGFGLLRWAQRRRALILAYHGVLSATTEEGYLDYNFPSAAQFERQLQFLTAHYKPTPLEQLVAQGAAGRALPERAVAVTFDDGFANNYSVAFPLLRKYDVPATIFLATGMIGAPGALLWTERVSRALCLAAVGSVELEVGESRRTWRLGSRAEREETSRAVLGMLKRTAPLERDAVLEEIERRCGSPPLRAQDAERYAFLSWEQVREMSAAGIEFGSHTVNHPIVSTVADDVLRRELADSKTAIEGATDRLCTSFAYPNGGPGDFGARDQRLVAAAGYQCALRLGGELVEQGSDPFAWPRVNVGRDYDDAMFEAATSGLLGLASRARGTLAGRQGERAAQVAGEAAHGRS